MSYFLKAGDKEFEFRMPTEAEAIEILDKKEFQSRQQNTNVLDDGDEEIMKLFLSPSLPELRAFVEKYPTFLEKVWEHICVVGNLQRVEEDESARTDVELQSKYQDKVFRVLWNPNTLEGSEKEWVPFLFKRLSRFDYKVMQKEIKQSGTISFKKLVERVKHNAVDRSACDQMAETQPFFYISMANTLYQLCQTPIEFDVKKA